MTARTTLPTLALVLVAAVLPGRATAQVEIVEDGETYIEMTPEELRSLVGKMQRLRAQRAQQYAYLRSRQSAGTTAPQTAYTTPGSSAGDARLRQLENEIVGLSSEMRLMREEMQRGLRQNPTQTADAQRSLDERRAYDDQRRAYDDRDREIRALREQYDRELRDERERNRRLERELADARRDVDYRRDYDRDLSRGLVTPAPAPAPTYVPVPMGDNGARDRELLARQDSLNRALALLRAELASSRGRDTVVIERAGERIVVRDTVRDTRVVTRTLAEERVDLAAVLFANNSAAINRAAEIQIAQAVEAYRREPSETILLRGFASRTGNVEYNQALSQRRAEAVRDRLAAQGVPLDHIRIIANGVDPGDNLAEARRVEIQLLRRPR